jgi:hypothetical protein
MKVVYLLVLVAMLLFIVGVGAYEGFNASSGGALIQLATSHVPTPDDVHVYGMSVHEDDDEVKQANPYTKQVHGMTNMDNTPYAPY